MFECFGFGGIEDVADMVVGAEDFNFVFEDSLKPIFVEVIVIEMGEEDGGDVGDVDADAGVGGHALGGGAGAEAGID